MHTLIDYGRQRTYSALHVNKLATMRGHVKCRMFNYVPLPLLCCLQVSLRRRSLRVHVFTNHYCNSVLSSIVLSSHIICMYVLGVFRPELFEARVTAAIEKMAYICCDDREMNAERLLER